MVEEMHHERRFEHLCRYAGRPAAAESRLPLLSDGRIAYSLKKHWKYGTSHVVMSLQVPLERLCALVPRPRRHLLTYHGVFAPAAGIRPWVVPQVPAADDGGGCQHTGAATAANVEVDARGQAGDEAGRPMPARRIVPKAPGRDRGKT